MGTPLGHPRAGDYRSLSDHIQLPGARFVGQAGKSVGVPVRCDTCGKFAAPGLTKRHRFPGCRDDIPALAASTRALTGERKKPVLLRSRCGDIFPV